MRTGRQYWELGRARETSEPRVAWRRRSSLRGTSRSSCSPGSWGIPRLWRGYRGDGGADAREAARALQRRRPEYAVERLTARARAVGIQGVSRAARQCFEVDQALKTGTGNPRALLTYLVAELAG